jgi:hypothetical protein
MRALLMPLTTAAPRAAPLHAQPPSPTTLRRLTDPESFYTDPSKRTPRWLEHVHPDRTNPAKQADAVPWRPASARPPAAPHTAGLQSVGV